MKLSKKGAMKVALSSFMALSMSAVPLHIDKPTVFAMNRVPSFTPARVLTIYEIAERVTGAPAHIMFGIACVESEQKDYAIGDQGRSRGRFQINEEFRTLRVEKYGEYDPHDPVSAAIIAGRIYMENYVALQDETLAICAYRQGIGGVRKHGATTWYSDRVYARIKKGA